LKRIKIIKLVAFMMQFFIKGMLHCNRSWMQKKSAF